MDMRRTESVGKKQIENRIGMKEHSAWGPVATENREI